jgi:hypothetical protein
MAVPGGEPAPKHGRRCWTTSRPSQPKRRAGATNVDQQVEKGGSVTGVKIGDDFG